VGTQALGRLRTADYAEGYPQITQIADCEEELSADYADYADFFFGLSETVGIGLPMIYGVDLPKVVRLKYVRGGTA
jgi:hypothetical protein